MVTETVARSTLHTVSLTGRLVRTRWVVAAALLALGGALLVALSIDVALTMRRIDTAGLHLRGLRVTSADARWPGVAPGDRLYAVGDVVGPHSYLEPLLDEAPVGDDATLTFMRGDRPIVVPVHVAALPARHQLALAGRILAGALCVLLGIICFLCGPARASRGCSSRSPARWR